MFIGIAEMESFIEEIEKDQLSKDEAVNSQEELDHCHDKYKVVCHDSFKLFCASI